MKRVKHLTIDFLSLRTHNSYLCLLEACFKVHIPYKRVCQLSVQLGETTYSLIDAKNNNVW